MQCFAQGKYSGNHRPWHDYQIIEQHAYPIFEEDWGADEELLLIEGMKNFGCGNWQDIADHIGGRTKEEVAEHYTRVYLESETYPVPNLKRKFNIDPTEFAQKRRKRIEENRANAMKLAPPKQKPNASVPSCHEVQGYMPGRLEFETEYENDAEMTIKDMMFDPEDNETEIELKLTILNIYNSRLTTRAERKRVMLEHGLLDYRKNMAIEKKKTKEEREFFNKIKALARLMTAQDYQTFIANITTELHCRRRIAELQEYRRNGIRTFAMAAKYENDKAVRMNALNSNGGSSNLISSNISQMMMLGGTRHTANSSSRYASGFNTPVRETISVTGNKVFSGSVHPLHHSTVDIKKYLSNDVMSMDPPAPPATAAPANGTAGDENTSTETNTNNINNTNNPADSANVELTTTSAAAHAATAANGQLSISDINTNALTPATAVRLAAMNNKLFRKPVANPLDISRATDVELLSPEEQVLCSQLRILPKPYLSIKETLFRELLRSGGVLKKRTARELIKIDVNKTARIYEFFQAQRWIAWNNNNHSVPSPGGSFLQLLPS